MTVHSNSQDWWRRIDDSVDDDSDYDSDYDSDDDSNYDSDDASDDASDDGPLVEHSVSTSCWSEHFLFQVVQFAVWLA